MGNCLSSLSNSIAYLIVLYVRTLYRFFGLSHTGMVGVTQTATLGVTQTGFIG